MMKKSLLTLLLLSSLAHASTWDEIAALEAGKGAVAAQPTAPATAPAAAARPARWLPLSNGQRVNLNNWKVVVFIQSSCPYCHKFDPVLKATAEQHGFEVMAFSLDGQGDQTYPSPLMATPEVMKEFFAGLPVATPTTFLVNVNTMATFPLLQGAVEQPMFLSRLDEVFLFALQGGQQ